MAGKGGGGMNAKRARRGFTLIELIVVLVILAILAAASLPALTGYVSKARDTAAISECGAVVRAAQARAVELAAFGRLGELVNEGDAILQACGMPGEIQSVAADASSASVTYLLYQCKNGLLVRYRPDEEPKFTIVRQGDGGGNAVAPQDTLDKMVSDTKDWLQEKIDAGQAPTDRNALADWAVKEENRVQVDDAYLDGWSSNAQGPFYWRGYYIGAVSEKNLIFYACPISPTGNSWGNWNAYFFYINGTVYRRPDGKTANIAGFYNTAKFPNPAAVERWLLEQGFVAASG